MANIQPVEFPLNIGTADELSFSMNVTNKNDGAILSYMLSDSTTKRILSRNNIRLSEEDFQLNGTNKDWLINYVATQIGATLL